MPKEILEEREIGYIKAHPTAKFKPEDLIQTLDSLAKQGKSEGFFDIYICVEVFVDGDAQIVVKGNRLETDKEYAARLRGEKQQKKHEYETYLRLKAHFESESGKKEIAELD